MPPTPPPPPEPGEPRIRDRGDACPGALRLHPADDGRLARLRLPGGRLTAHQAVVLAGAAETLGDGRVSITSRGNAELRGLGEGCGAELAALLDGAGLLPSPTHERVRNIVASPAAGLDGNGHADVQLWARDLDALLCADPRAAALSGRFLFALDDGRADVAALGADVTLIAVPAATGVAESSGSSTGVGGTAAAGGGGTGPGAEAESPAEAEAAGPAREAGAAAVSGRAAAEAGGSAQAGGAAQAGVAAEAGPSTEAASAASASEAGAAAVSGRAAAEAGGSARAGGAAQAGPPTEAASAASASEAGVTAQAGVTAEAGPPTEAASAGPVEAPGADAAAAPTGGARPVCDALLRVGAQVFRVSGEDAARAAVVAALAFLDAARVAGNGAWRVRELPEGHPLDLAGALARAGVAAEPVRESTGTSTVTEHLGAGAVPGPSAGPGTGTGTGTSPGGRLLPGVLGGRAVHVLAPLGRLTAAQLRGLADGAEEVRLTPWRGAVVVGVPAARLDALEAYGLVTRPDSPWVGVSACTGRPGCAKSLADVRADAAPATAGLPVHLSGCERRCGHPHGTWIDVLATGDGAYLVDGVPTPRTSLTAAVAAARSQPTHTR